MAPVDEHVAGRPTAAGLQNPAMAVWCRPGPGHTSQVSADSGQALPREHSHDQQHNTAFQRPFILRADERLCLQVLRNPAINGAQNPASNAVPNYVASNAVPNNAPHSPDITGHVRESRFKKVKLMGCRHVA